MQNLTSPRYASLICRGFSLAKCAKHTMRMSWTKSKRILIVSDVSSRGNLLAISYPSSCAARIPCRPGGRARLRVDSSKHSPERLREQHAKSRSVFAKLPIKANCLACRSVFSCSRSFEGSSGKIGFSRHGDVLSNAEDQEDRMLL